jgi:CcmD family protein
MMKYLFAAYTVIWIVLFIYMFSLSRRVNGVKKELEVLSEEREK